MQQANTNNEEQTSQAEYWSDAELQRATRIFDLLSNINERIKKGANNEEVNEEG